MKFLKKFKKIYADKKLKIYKNWIKNIRKFKPYQLDVKTEKLLQEKILLLDQPDQTI